MCQASARPMRGRQNTTVGEQLGREEGGRRDIFLVASLSLVFSSLFKFIPRVQLSVLDKESIDLKVLDTK